MANLEQHIIKAHTIVGYQPQNQSLCKWFDLRSHLWARLAATCRAIDLGSLPSTLPKKLSRKVKVKTNHDTTPKNARAYPSFY